MKPGKRDKPTYIKFTKGELNILQENSYQMVEAYGLDRKIDRLTGKRKVMFYSWDLDCLDSVLCSMEKSYTKKEDVETIKSLQLKIEKGYKEIKEKEEN